MKLREALKKIEEKHNITIEVGSYYIETIKDDVYIDNITIDEIDYTGYSTEKYIDQLMDTEVEFLTFKRRYDGITYNWPALKELEELIIERIE